MKRGLSILLAMMFLFTAVFSASIGAVYASSDEDRLWGQNRYETACAIAKAKYTTAETVIIVRGDGPSDNPNVVDGLTASVLAGAKDAPILLTEDDKLPEVVKTTITDLKAEKAYIVGGTGAVSEDVKEELEALGLEVERVEGNNRFETAVAVAKKADTGAKTAIVTNYIALSDALVAGPVAYLNKYPILLVYPDKVGDVTAKAIKDLGIENVIIVGGTGVVSDAVKEELEDLVSGNVTRLGGTNRYATSLEVAKELDKNDVVLVNGLNFVDAVAASALGLPILYVKQNSMEDYIEDYLATRASVKFIGGTGVISESLANEARNAIVLDVKSVTAVNPTTLKIEGKGLKKLAASDITVEDNKVKSLSVAADGKSATVTLEEKLAPNVEFVVTVNVNDEEKEFKVEYVYKVTSVEIGDQVFDDDRAGQKVIFKVNGETADIDYLKLAGYDVTFIATENNAAANIFVDDDNPSGPPTNVSSSGVLAVNQLTAGKEYKVEVQVSKGGEALIDTATIKIVNLDAEATVINSVKFKNFGANQTEDSSPVVDDFIMNSTTLVVGEKIKVNEVKATVAGQEVQVTDFSVTTSNSAIISVASDKTIKAESAGNATITIKVGNVTKSYNFTVTNTDRKLAKVTVNPASVTIVRNENDGTSYSRTITVKTFDQYGDPIKVANTDWKVEIPGNITVTSPSPIETNAAGEVTLVLEANAAGSGTIYFKDKGGKVLASAKVSVSNVDNTGDIKLEIASSSESKDNVLTLNRAKDDDTVTYQLSRYNTKGEYVEAVDLSNYVAKIKVLDGDVARIQDGANEVQELTVSSSTNDVTVVAKAAGKTDVVFYDANGNVYKKVTITVVEEDPITIKSVTFKQPVSIVDYVGAKITYKTVLDVIASEDDDILTGITLSKSTLHKVRISKASGTEGYIYLDVNGDGVYTAGSGVNDDILLGQLIFVTTGDSNFTLSSSHNVVTGYTTQDGNNGTLLFKVLTVPGNEKTAIASVAVKIEVK